MRFLRLFCCCFVVIKVDLELFFVRKERGVFEFLVSGLAFCMCSLVSKVVIKSLFERF